MINLFRNRENYEKKNFDKIYSKEIDRLWVVNTGNKLVWVAIGNACFTTLSFIYTMCLTKITEGDDELEVIGGILDKEK